MDFVMGYSFLIVLITYLNWGSIMVALSYNATFTIITLPDCCNIGELLVY